MQVSIACTEHSLKGRNGEHVKQSSTSPGVVNAARAKFRTVAIIARSFGSFTPRHHISLKESTGKHTGMKYRADLSVDLDKAGRCSAQFCAPPALGGGASQKVKAKHSSQTQLSPTELLMRPNMSANVKFS
ncbi:hypothetical protein MHYP_G00128270 [Metynnis hypsauchen]